MHMIKSTAGLTLYQQNLGHRKRKEISYLSGIFFIPEMMEILGKPDYIATVKFQSVETVGYGF